MAAALGAALAAPLDDDVVAVPQPATRRVTARSGPRADVLEELSRDRVIESPSDGSLRSRRSSRMRPLSGLGKRPSSVGVVPQLDDGTVVFPTEH
jgi:hypothetical protein